MRPETALLVLEWSHIVLWAVLASFLAWPLVREWWQERGRRGDASGPS